ncbi:MAG: hypothetical protein JNK64_06235 [Myxococcales bacterium]|nr:hypothetical protein [Myxococcales bacterium]
MFGSDTWTEWEVADYNEDGYPDLLSESLPVAVCVSDDADPLLRNPSPDPLDPSGSTSTWTSNCPSGATCRGVITDDRAERLAFEPCADEVGHPVDGSTPVVFLNRMGAFDDLPTLGRWTAPLDADLGALSRWTEEYPNEEPSASPGARQTHRLADDDALGRLQLSTEAGEVYSNDRATQCRPDGSHEVSDRQRGGVIDVNGDGLQDFVSHDALRWNTGAGSTSGTEALRIFALDLSVAVGGCGHDDVKRNVSSLTDLDADGLPDRIFIDGGVLKMSSPVSDAGAPFTAGRLVAIGNGFGAVTSIRYANAKIDSTTRHAVPFPEIVVDRVKTEVVDGSGPSLAATYYRFGDARYEYDGASTSWRFAGY